MTPDTARPERVRERAHEIAAEFDHCRESAPESVAKKVMAMAFARCDVERAELVARVQQLETALREARELAIAVADKRIGELSEQARVVQGECNAALGDVPSTDDVTGILARVALGEET